MMATLSSSRGMSSSLMFNVVMVEAGFKKTRIRWSSTPSYRNARGGRGRRSMTAPRAVPSNRMCRFGLR